MSSESPDKASRFWTKPAPLTIVGVVLLGIVGSTLYDLLVKPGLSSFGRFCLDVVTLGSATARNAAYSSAALDPTPVTSLYILQIIILLGFLPAARMVERTLFRTREREFESRIENVVPEQRKELIAGEIGRLKRKLRFLTRFFWVVFIVWVGMAVVAFAIHNQSVVIWRAFHANLEIISPVTTESEAKQLRASFASMQNSSDYQVLRKRMEDIAEGHRLKLRSIETW